MRPGQDSITASIADQWAGERCYLNGAPAKVAGRLNRTATIQPLNPALQDEFYSWHAVNRIMRDHGGFFDTTKL